MIQQDHQLPRTRRCELLSVPRSSSYYQPKPIPDADLALMKLIDRIHMDKPFLGSRRIVDALAEQGERRVGVRFYGHRVGWNTKQPTDRLVQQEYARPIPSDLMPYEDVELILPLGRFDQIAAGRVAQLIAKAEHEVEENPGDWSKVVALVDLLCREDDETNEGRAIKFLVDAYKENNNYQYNWSRLPKHAEGEPFYMDVIFSKTPLEKDK